MNTNEKQAADELNQVRRFRKLPKEIDAARLTDHADWDAIALWCSGDIVNTTNGVPGAEPESFIEIVTLADSARKVSARYSKKATYLDGEKQFMGESYRHGILQIKYKVVWSLRESMGKLIEKKQPNTVGKGHAKRAKAAAGK